MKTANEVRKLRDDMLATLRAPCECAKYGPLAALACEAGKERLRDFLVLLGWLLGENDEAERWVEQVAEAARRL